MNSITVDNDTFFSEVEELLTRGIPVRIKVSGESMRPFLRSGKDSVELAAAEPEKLRRGDIVLFRYRSGYFLHRVISINNGKYLMQGDGITNHFETAESEDIIGVATAILRPGGRVIHYRKNVLFLIWSFWRALGTFRSYLVGFDKLIR